MERLPQRKPFHGHDKNSEKTFSAKKPFHGYQKASGIRKDLRKGNHSTVTIRILETLSPQTVSAGIGNDFRKGNHSTVTIRILERPSPQRNRSTATRKHQGSEKTFAKETIPPLR
jgi:hypothetical protein